MTKFVKINKFVQFWTDLNPRVINNMQFTYRKTPLVYAIRCEVNQMVYVGSTFIPGRRFDNHLVTGNYSNDALQADIKAYGLESFSAYVLEIAKFPDGMTSAEKGNLLRQLEQRHLDLFPKDQLYNTINSSNT